MTGNKEIHFQYAPTGTRDKKSSKVKGSSFSSEEEMTISLYTHFEGALKKSSLVEDKALKLIANIINCKYLRISLTGLI